MSISQPTENSPINLTSPNNDTISHVTPSSVVGALLFVEAEPQISLLLQGGANSQKLGLGRIIAAVGGQLETETT